MTTLNANQIKNIEVDLEHGFIWAEGKEDYSNLFQACLTVEDGKFVSKIEENDSGYNWGICADYNESIGYDDLEDAYSVFIESCKSFGIEVI